MLRSLILTIATFMLTRATIAGLGPVGPVKKIHGDFTLAEGPAVDKYGNLFFTDIPASRIYKLNTSGELSVFREPTNNANGLIVGRTGELLACEAQGQVVAYSADGKERRVIAAQYNGARFNAPNDLVMDSTGGVYFSDPHFSAPKPLPQGVEAVYYVDSKGEVTRLIDDLAAPNGVILSTDEKTLYVVPSLQPEMMAYSIESPGRLGRGRVFARLKGKWGDGLTLDKKGNFYITSKVGLQVFSPAGKALGIIDFGEKLTNVTFGGPEGKTLFVTSHTSLYSAAMEVKGHVFANGQSENK